MKTLSNIFSFLFKSLSIVLLFVAIWIVLSWFDVITHNMTYHTDYLQYAWWNFFEIIF